MSGPRADIVIADDVEISFGSAEHLTMLGHYRETVARRLEAVLDRNEQRWMTSLPFGWGVFDGERITAQECRFWGFADV